MWEVAGVKQSSHICLFLLLWVYVLHTQCFLSRLVTMLAVSYELLQILCLWIFYIQCKNYPQFTQLHIEIILFFTVSTVLCLENFLTSNNSLCNFAYLVLLDHYRTYLYRICCISSRKPRVLLTRLKVNVEEDTLKKRNWLRNNREMWSERCHRGLWRI